MREDGSVSNSPIESAGKCDHVADLTMGLPTGMLGGYGAMGMVALRFVEEAQTSGIGLLA
jgi:hypothetical protein